MSDVAQTGLVPVEGSFDLTRTDPVAALQRAETLIKYMAGKCSGPKFVSQIQGRSYPKVEWWTTVGAGVGLFPQEEACVKLEREGEIAYQATVGVYHAGQIVSRGSAICSSKERTWKSRDEYAIRSMALTRATGKAYRMAFSFLAVMAGLEPTPAEEMPEDKPEPPPDSEQEFNRDDAVVMRDMLLSYLLKVEGTVGAQRAEALRAAVAKNEASGQWKRFREWLAAAYEALKAEVEKQEALLAANTTAKPANPLEKALDTLGATVGAKAGEKATKPGELYDHE